MEEALATEIAGAYLEQEGIVGADVHRLEREQNRMARSLQALIGDDVGDTWAVVRLHALSNPREHELYLVALSAGTVHLALLQRSGDEEVPNLVISRYQAGEWRINNVTDQVSRDSAGAPRVKRGWTLELGPSLLIPRAFVFGTDQIITDPFEPNRVERLGRDLAKATGWRVTDLGPEPS